MHHGYPAGGGEGFRELKPRDLAGAAAESAGRHPGREREGAIPILPGADQPAGLQRGEASECGAEALHLPHSAAHDEFAKPQGHPTLIPPTLLL